MRRGRPCLLPEPRHIAAAQATPRLRRSSRSSIATRAAHQSVPPIMVNSCSGKARTLQIAATIYWGSECMNYSRLSYPANDLLAEPSGFLAGTAVAVS